MCNTIIICNTTNTCNTKSKNEIFTEAISHCRWKKALMPIIEKINMSDYNTKTFEQIISEISNMCKDVNGLGMLAVYDITAAICRYYNINIDKIYIVGNGPKRAIKILNLKTKTQNINDKIKIRYIEICDVINAFDVNKYKLDQKMRENKNGDIFESYLCNWQKII